MGKMNNNCLIAQLILVICVTQDSISKTEIIVRFIFAL